MEKILSKCISKRIEKTKLEETYNSTIHWIIIRLGDNTTEFFSLTDVGGN